MWIFWFVPGLLFLVAFMYDAVCKAIDRHYEDHPYIGHLNCRNTGYRS